MVWDIVVNVLLVVLFIVVTVAFIWLLAPEIKRSTRNAGTSMKEKKWRCRSCKNCKMLFEDGKGAFRKYISAWIVIKTSTRATINGGIFAVVSGYKVKRRFNAHLYQDKRTP